MDDWTFLEKGWETGTAERKEEGGGERNWGSGYPSGAFLASSQTYCRSILEDVALTF